jgi:hypothetical protein
MDREICTGTRKGKACGGALFKCGHCGALGCEKSGCDNRQFRPIERCKDCGRAYERIKQYRPSAAAEGGLDSRAAGPRIALPNVELLFGAVLGVVVLAALVVGALGIFRGPQSVAAAPPQIEAISVASAEQAFTDVCQCYRQGMSLAGTGLSVLSSEYRTGFIQCRAAFGAQGGEAWTAGWNARASGKLIGAGCRSWMRNYGG